MINKSGFISQKFIKYFFDNEIPIPFLNERVAILIDCNRYINKNKKLFNIFLICWLTEGLNSIGMKYSVTLIFDDNYKRIIKKYETPQSKYKLQKIYEFCMLPRFRTKLVKNLHFVIDNLENDSSY